MIPPDIKQVIARLKARGLIGYRTPESVPHITSFRKTERTECKWCGKNISAVFGHHICINKRKSLQALVLAVLLPLCAMGQTKTNLSILILDARVTFIQPAGKEAKVYTRTNSKASWTLWQQVPKNTLPFDQGVILMLPRPVYTTTQCQVIFQ
jgi:hypothetical protein